MYRLSVILLAAAAYALSSGLSFAQVTNPCPALPATKLESFDTNVSIVIIKGTTDIGALSVSTGVVWVKCREVTDAATGRKEQGILVEITPKGQARDVLFIDYDEIASLSNAVGYLNRLDYSVTPLDSYDAAYTTKGGFRIATLGSRRTGVIRFGIRDIRTTMAPIALSREEISRFGSLIDQAKAKLDSLRAG